MHGGGKRISSGLSRGDAKKESSERRKLFFSLALTQRMVVH